MEPLLVTLVRELKEIWFEDSKNATLYLGTYSGRAKLNTKEIENIKKYNETN